MSDETIKFIVYASWHEHMAVLRDSEEKMLNFNKLKIVEQRCNAYSELRAQLDELTKTGQAFASAVESERRWAEFREQLTASRELLKGLK